MKIESSLRFKSFLVIVVVVCLFGSVGLAKYGGGKGTAADPYQIWNAEQMQSIGRSTADWGKHFVLMEDIDLGGYTGTSYNIIGEFTGWGDPRNNPFAGVFDGNGHTISNFTYDSNETDYIGLFGYVDGATATIRDLGLLDPNVNAANGWNVGSLVGFLADGSVINCYVDGCIVSGDRYVGGLLGEAWTCTISNCHVNGSVTGKRYVGGLIGAGLSFTNAQMSNCTFSGTVFGWTSVGGLIGAGGGLISGCSSAGDVSSQFTRTGGLFGNFGGLHGGAYKILSSHSSCTVSGTGYIGGLIGENDGGAIVNCYAVGDVSATASVNYVGGLVGISYQYQAPNSPVIASCYASGNVNGAGDVGGLVGCASGSITESFSMGTVWGFQRAGGLVGQANGEIYNCYFKGGIVSGSHRLGGFIGQNDGTVFNCFSSTASPMADGFVGYDDGGSYSGCFWDSTLNPSHNGIGNGTDPNVIGKTTAEMQTESTFTDAGWDFVGEVINGPNDIWDICEGTNYPKFVWQIPVGDFMCPDGVNMVDFAVLGEAWLSEFGDLNWEASCDISEPNDNVIDGLDLGVFVGNWLEGL
ncbi:MAG: GLUG motif-containing protein [Planctomycetota bacterium]|jgi:hypothetical protein